MFGIWYLSFGICPQRVCHGKIMRHALILIAFLLPFPVWGVTPAELAQLAEALERVRAAENEVRLWAPLTVMNTLTALEAELQTILARL